MEIPAQGGVIIGGGTAGAGLRAHAWSDDPLGSPDGWPEWLRGQVNTVLAASVPMALVVAGQRRVFCNDAFAAACGLPGAAGGLVALERLAGAEALAAAIALAARGTAGMVVVGQGQGGGAESVKSGGSASTKSGGVASADRDGAGSVDSGKCGPDGCGKGSTGADSVRGGGAPVQVSCVPAFDGASVRGVLLLAATVAMPVAAPAPSPLDNLARLHELFDLAPGPIAILSGPEHRYVFSNRANSAYTGGLELEGRAVRELFPPELSAQFVGLLDNVYRTGEPLVGRATAVDLPTPEGGTRRVYLDFVYHPIRNDNGDIVGIFHQASDVTAAVVANDALRLSEQRLREGATAARMVAWEWDLRTGTVTCSDNAREILGYDLADVEERWKQVVPEDVDQVRAAFAEAIAGDGKLKVISRRIRADDGRVIWVDNRGTVVRDEEGAAIAVRGITVDVTERVAAEHELQAANRRKDEFLAMLAHELRNPLAPIATAAMLLKLPEADTARSRHAVEVIDRQVRHMTALVDDLLDVSRVTRGLVQLEMAPCELGAIVASAVEQSRPLIEARGHRLDVRTGLDASWVLGERTRLVQVIANLLNNAAKYTPPGGQIVLALSGSGSDSMATVTVRDNGSGIDAALLPRVFDLFSQGERTPDRSQGGLGIGLALVQRLVQLHGGSVTARSAGRGQGSIFTVTLPRVAAGAERVPDAGPRVATQPRAIVVVDDHADGGALLASWLRTQGHRVTLHASAHSALESDQVAQADMFVLDIGLPDMDGYTLATALRVRAAPQALFVALTGYGRQQDRERSLAAGFHHHLVKPVHAPQLLELIAALGAGAH